MKNISKINITNNKEKEGFTLNTNGKEIQLNNKNEENKNSVTNDKIISTDNGINSEQYLMKRLKYQEHLLVNCRSVEDFEKVEEIGEGTYGRVCKY
jgi:hypothetical protein